MLGGGFGRRGRSGLCDAGGSDRQADAGNAGQADLVARRRHAARHVSSRDAMQAGRRVRRRQQSDRTAHAHFGPVDPGRGVPAKPARRPDPATFQGLNPTGRIRVRLFDSEPADRSLDAQSACPARLLARRERQPERHLYRMLHGRAGAGGRTGSAGIPPQADEQTPEEPRRAQRRGRERSDGASRRRKASIAACRIFMAFGSYVAAARGNLRRPAAATSRSTASSPRPIRAMRSIRRRSSGRSPARSSMACRRCSTANAR